ncbi:MAG: hypothetical protein D6761_06220 [Candidatus Dadabacteria bacterium]|nr:MAG: hypothetical protein D6761_06220 [Candidatus Dadabacteria bacterium]
MPYLVVGATLVLAPAMVNAAPTLTIEGTGARIDRPDLHATFASFRLTPDGALAATDGTFTLKRAGKTVHGTVASLRGRLTNDAWRFDALRLSRQGGFVDAGAGTIDTATGVFFGQPATVDSPRIRINAAEVHGNLREEQIVLEGRVRGALQR